VVVDADDAAAARSQFGGGAVDALVARGLARSKDFSWARCASGLADLYRDAVREQGTERGGDR